MATKNITKLVKGKDGKNYEVIIHLGTDRMTIVMADGTRQNVKRPSGW